jgi:acetyl esterase/lipase
LPPLNQPARTDGTLTADPKPAAPVLGPAAPTIPAVSSIQVREELNIVYGKGGGESLKLDLYAPSHQSGPVPAVVFIHGGAWSGGCKEDLTGSARAFAARGYVTVTVNYRLAPRHKWPAQIHDVKCAVRWLRANADRYHIDPDCIAASGNSAGGHLALLLGLTGPHDGFEGEGGHATQSSSVRAVVNLAGPTDLTRPGWSPIIENMIANWLGGSPKEAPTAYWGASPVSYARPGAPPVLTIHGTEDPVVPYEQARLLDTALHEARDSSLLEPLTKKGHFVDWNREDWQHCETVIADFLDRHLRKRVASAGN